MTETTLTTRKSTGTAAVVGGGLIVLGALALFSRFVPAVGEVLWAITFGAVAGILFNVYRDDKQRWWVLLPAYGLAFLSGVMALSLLRFTPIPHDTLGMLIGAYVCTAIALPFYFLYRQAGMPWWIALIGVPPALVALGLLTGAFMPVLPALMIIGGIYMVVRFRSNQPAIAAPAAPAIPEPIEFVPLSGPKADR
jgi:hypothetical protein